MTARPDIHYLDIDTLYLHRLNPRQTVPDGDAELMADSIAVGGLLQNLVGWRDDKTSARTGIVAGGRRLRGLQWLAERGAWTDKVPVKIVTSEAEALNAAAAENEGHIALSTSQEIRLYARLVDNMLTPGAIARAHAVTERHVKQRLALARLPDAAIDALDAREITLEQARALTLSDDPARVLDLLDTIRGRDFRPDWIRRQLLGEMVRSSDPRAVLVGEDTFVAAGGQVTRDLFSDHDYWNDDKLLDSLALHVLRAEADRVQAEEGWAEVRVTTASYGPPCDKETAKLRHIDPTPTDLPEADMAELEALAETPDRTDAQEIRMMELEARARGDYTDDQRATGIIWLHPSRAGRIVRAEAWTAKRASTTTTTTGDAARGSTPEPEAPGLSQSLRDDLHRIATAALQAAMLDADKRYLAFAILALELPLRHYHRASTARIDAVPNMPSIDTGLTLPEGVTETAIDTDDRPDPARLRDILGGDVADFLDTLQHAIARSLTARPDDWGRAIMAEAGADIRRHWTPDAANFFGRCPTRYLDAVYAQIAPDAPEDTTAAFAAQKKAQKAETLEKIFAGDTDQRAIWRIEDSPEADARIATWLPEDLATMQESHP